MSLQAIVEKIKTDALAEAEAIKAKAESKVNEIRKETDKQSADLMKSFEVALEKKKTQREAIVRSLEKQRSGMSLQESKRKLLDSLYEQAFAEVLALPAEEYVKLLSDKYSTLVPKDIKVASILAPEARLKETAEVAKTLGLTAEITPSSKIKGGCILTGENFEYNLSLEHLFNEDRTVSEMEIANQLFQTK